MEFKVGDKVKFVGDYTKHSTYFGKKLEDFIKENKNVLYITNVCLDYVQVNRNTFWCFRGGELQRLDYTYEDLKKSPIGTKVAFENGEVLVKDDDGNYSNKKRWRDDSDLKELKDRINTLGKIIKIEEPTYQTVYEVKQEILDEAEKRYLRGVIRPFRDRVEYIQKFTFSTGKAKITIKTEKDNDTWYVGLPPFKKDAMYKNMEPEREYTLEELGL